VERKTKDKLKVTSLLINT